MIKAMNNMAANPARKPFLKESQSSVGMFGVVVSLVVTVVVGNSVVVVGSIITGVPVALQITLRSLHCQPS